MKKAIVTLCAALFLLITPSCSESAGEMPVKAEPSQVLEQYSYDEFLSLEGVKYEQSLMLINKQYKISDTDEFDIVEYKDTDVFMNECMTLPYSELSSSVSERFSEKLFVMDAYRTAEEQQQAIIDEGDKAAGVNESEHQAGLALDVYVKYYAGQAFLKTETGKYVNSDCWQYGFIIRYPSYGERITGIAFEPWHIRYVGKPHAQIIMENKLTLEEYIMMYEPGEIYDYGDYFITRQTLDEISVSSFESAVISKDNTGHCIITAKKA